MKQNKIQSKEVYRFCEAYKNIIKNPSVSRHNKTTPSRKTYRRNLIRILDSNCGFCGNNNRRFHFHFSSLFHPTRATIYSIEWVIVLYRNRKCCINSNGCICQRSNLLIVFYWKSVKTADGHLVGKLYSFIGRFLCRLRVVTKVSCDFVETYYEFYENAKVILTSSVPLRVSAF